MNFKILITAISVAIFTTAITVNINPEWTPLMNGGVSGFIAGIVIFILNSKLKNDLKIMAEERTKKQIK